MIESYEITIMIMGFIALAYFLKYNNEMLFLPLFFFWNTGISRYEAIETGRAGWAIVNYTMDIFSFSLEKAELALGLFFTGTAVFFISFIFFSTLIKNNNKPIDSYPIFREFILSKSSFIIRLFISFLILNTLFRGMITGSAAYGNSYFMLFGMAIGGLILLMYILYQHLNFSTDSGKKTVYLLLILYSAVLSYNPNQRFQFLSWLIAIGILITQFQTTFVKLRSYIIGGFIVVIIFSIAGVSRNNDLSKMTLIEIYDAAMNRYDTAEDQNMLDGFMMVLDVYPQHLDFSYGMEHLEILMRPIPRQLWPGKPVGGYHNKLGLNDINSGKTVGISQTIYGSFYGEGGLPGIIIFSILYGLFFTLIFNYTDRYNSDMKWLLRGITVAWILPLLRGGDLPGIVAWLGMSYWPVFWILYQYNKYLKELGN